MKKIIIYGNCHTGLIIEYLKACVDFNDKYEILEIPQIQEIYNSNNMNLDTIPFQKCDIFIHQSIRINNRYGKDYASQNIIRRLKKGCKIISIPNLYGLPLYLFPQCSKNDIEYNGKSYFFRDKIIDSVVKKYFTLDEILEVYNDSSIYNEDTLNEKWKIFIEKVRKREEDWDIKVSDYINNNRNTPMFHDPNHPNNYFIEFVVEELCKLLHVTIDISNVRKYITYKLDAYEMPVCASVKSKFNIKCNKQLIRTSICGRKICHKDMDLRVYIEQYLVLLWLNGELSQNFTLGKELHKKCKKEEKMRYLSFVLQRFILRVYKRTIRFLNLKMHCIVSVIKGR